jgi:hypothetical protein
MDVYYDPATLNTSAYYNWINGRGNNTGFHSGMMIPGGLNESAFEGRWRLQSTGSTISKTGLTADWYRYSMIVTATTFRIKLLNLRTNVLLEGSAVGIGTVDNADNFDYTALCYGISGVTGAYGTVGVNFSNFRITRSGVTLVNLPFSTGAGTQIVNVYNGAVYNLGFFTASTGWAKLSDYCHYNFVNGFTLYQKDANPDIRIPNKIDGTEITITPPSGYTRISNQKASLLTFNQCESKVKLDDVDIQQEIIVTNATDTILNGKYQRHGDYAGKSYWYDGDLGTYTHFFNWDGIKWNWGTSGGITLLKSNENVAHPWLVQNWVAVTGNLPAGNIVEKTASALYSADIDRVLFTEGTGVAKEFFIGDIKIEEGIDRGYLYINEDIEQKDFMLYSSDKTLLDDLKIIKYLGYADRVSYDEEEVPNYDENNHVELSE